MCLACSLLHCPAPHPATRRTNFKELQEEFGLPPVKGLWTAEKRLGGWKQIQTEFFEDTVRAWLLG